jgi:hypothetical protein
MNGYALLTAVMLAVTLNAIEIEIPFSELAKVADAVLLVRVADVRSRWHNDASGKAIVTDVAFTVERVYKGRPVKEITLRIAGGTIGRISQQVDDASVFAVGTREIIFVRASNAAVPTLAGGVQGRYLVTVDAKTGRETTRPAYDPAARPITLQAFEQQLQNALKTSR